MDTSTTTHATLDRRWVLLQGVAAGGLIVGAVSVMVGIAGVFVPVLGVVATLCAAGLAMLPVRPRPAAIAVGVVSLLFGIASLVNIGAVLANLREPGAVLPFLSTAVLQLANLLGVVGLAGATMRAPGAIARRALQAAAATLTLCLAASALAAVAT